MRFTDQDLQVLTNFSEVCENMIFQKGKIQRTINTMNSMMCEYEMENEISKKFCLTDLDEFLNIHDLFDKPNIKLQNNKLILKDKKFTSEYYTTDEKVLKNPPGLSPDEKLNIKEYDYQFLLSKNNIIDYNLIRKRTKKNLPDIIIQNKVGNFNFELLEKRNEVSNKVSFNIDESNKTNRKFKFYFKCEHIDKILIDDYIVEVSTKKIMKLTNRNKNLRYWIALESQSEFDSNKSEVKTNA